MIRSAKEKSTRFFRKEKSGTALVEFSLLLPLLVSIFAGIVEFGNILQQYHVANKGVKSAARYMARVAGDGSCPIGNGWTTNEGDAKYLAQHGSFEATEPFLLSNWQNANQITITVTCIDNISGGFRGNEQIPTVTVSTSFDYADIGLLSFLPGNGVTITATHEQMYIGG